MNIWEEGDEVEVIANYEDYACRVAGVKAVVIAAGMVDLLLKKGVKSQFIVDPTNFIPYEEGTYECL